MDSPSIVMVVMTCCVVTFTALAAFIDWRWGKIPNWLTVSSFAAALVFHFLVGYFGWNGEDGGWLAAATRLMWALLGFATGFSILLVLWLTKGGMGGDVKLMGAIGTWLLPWHTLMAFLVACLLQTIVSVCRVIVKLMNGSWSETRKEMGKDGGRKKAKQVETNPWKRAIPFGVPVAVATWGVVVFQLIQAIQRQ
jgi:prepilin peptidase CpaA